MTAKLKCLTCGKLERSPEHRVCESCFKIFHKEDGKNQVLTGKPLSFSEWVKKRVKERFKDLQNQLQETQEKYDVLQKEVQNKAFQNSTEGKYVEQREFNETMRQKKRKLWQEGGGNRLHWQLKNLEKETTLLEGALEGFEELSKASSQEKSQNPNQSSN